MVNRKQQQDRRDEHRQDPAVHDQMRPRFRRRTAQVEQPGEHGEAGGHRHEVGGQPADAGDPGYAVDGCADRVGQQGEDTAEQAQQDDERPERLSAIGVGFGRAVAQMVQMVQMVQLVTECYPDQHGR